MPTVYGLFVGINKYQNVTPLFGCVEDINAIEEFFTNRIAPESRAFVALRDAEATREAIIDGFRTHLSRAREDDIALFYYCGHGSTEPAPPEWQSFDSDGKNQTLIPVDARANGVYDIADKELTALIQGVHDAAGNDRVQVVVIADSCHSGGNTRAVDDDGVGRMTAAARTERTLDDYLPEARALYDPKRVAANGLPTPRHVALAACQSDEIAKEFPKDPPPRRGAFTVAFEEAVRALGSTATYTGLINAIRMKVRERAAAQVPNLYVSGGATANDVFLGGQAGRNDLTVDHNNAGWWLSAGAIDSIPSPAQGHVTTVAIYERGTSIATTAPGAPVATAVVAQVESDRARLEVSPVGAPLDTSRQYIGAVTSLETPALQVVIEAEAGAEDAAKRVRSRLAGSSPRFAVVDKAGKVPCVTAVVHGNSVQLRAGAALLEGLTYRADDSGLAALVTGCEHLAHWYQVRDLAPPGSRLNGQLRIELVPLEATEKGADVPEDRPALSAEDGSLTVRKGARIQMRLRNDATERLYVALLQLDGTAFACTKMFADWIPAGGVGVVNGGKAMRMEILEDGVASVTDYFKAVVAIEDFVPERWELPPLVVPAGTRAVVEDEAPPTRGAEGLDAFWGTTTLEVTTAR